MARRSDRTGAEAPPPSAERQIAFRLGLSAESRAAAFLIAKGYRIVARRWRSALGEIDIVARRGGILAFVEVKARSDFDKAGFSLYSRQFGRVARAASLFLAHHPRYAAHSVRFDAILVVGLWPRHLPDVWRPPE